MSDTPSTNKLARDAMPLLDRMESMGKETLVLKAIRKCEPGNRKGNISKCWELDAYTLFECAKMHILEHRSAQQVIDTLGDRMGTVNRRSLSGWLKTLRDAYGELYNAQLSDLKHAESLAYQSGDLVAILGLVFAAIAPKFIILASMMDEGASTDQQHVFLRFLDISTTAAKVQADAKHAEAKTKHVLAKLSDMVRDGKGKPKTSDEVRAAVVALVDEMMTGGGTP